MLYSFKYSYLHVYIFTNKKFNKTNYNSSDNFNVDRSTGTLYNMEII